MASVNWNNIRPLNGSQNAGFEELCAQLARLETPRDAKFTRTGNPDAGVEGYCVLPSGDEWCWQAKYFFLSALLSGRKSTTPSKPPLDKTSQYQAILRLRSHRPSRCPRRRTYFGDG